MSQSRNYGIDCIKGICILLIVLWHADMFAVLPAVPKTIFDAILLNAFFVISGFLYYGKNDDKFGLVVWKKFKSLAIPYVCFSLLAIIWHSILVLGFDCREISDSYFGASLIARDIFCMGSGLGIGTLWFLPVLFVAWLGMASLVKGLKKHLRLQIILFLVLFVVCNMLGFYFRDLEIQGVNLKAKVLGEYSYMLHRILYGFSYAMLGVVLRHLYNFLKTRKKCVCILLELVLVLVAIVCYVGNLPFPTEVAICVCFVLGILLLGQKACPGWVRPITYMGQHSLEVMIYHYLFLLPVERMLLKSVWPEYLQLPFAAQSIILFGINVAITTLLIWGLGRIPFVMKMFGKKI